MSQFGHSQSRQPSTDTCRHEPLISDSNPSNNTFSSTDNTSAGRMGVWGAAGLLGAPYSAEIASAACSEAARPDRRPRSGADADGLIHPVRFL